MTNKKKPAIEIKDLILGVIKDNYSNPDFSVQFLADKLRICVSYLREIVCDKFGICPQQLIGEYRLSIALELIPYKKNFRIVSRKTGYNSIRTFRRAFKNKFGISPLTFYREYHRNKNARLNILNYYKSMFIIS